MASLSTAATLPRGDEGLSLVDESAIAVTFFNALERCTPGQLDNDRYGIVVRSLERRERMGGALPRMPGIVNEWAQFQHARIKNAKLVSFEPYELFRHDVVKAIEPEATWQPTGGPAPEKLPWHKDENVCGPLAARARDLVLVQLFGKSETTTPLADDLLPNDVESLYVTIYIDGRLRGCMGLAVRKLDDDVRKIVAAALDDQRFDPATPISADSVAVSVSLLFNPLEIGYAPPEEVVNYYRHGDQTLMAYRGDRVGLLLPFVASFWNYDAVNFATAVLEKADITEPPYNWCRFDSATWLATNEGAWPTVGGFAAPQKHLPPVNDLIATHCNLHLRYLLKHLRDDGTFYSGYQPFQNRLLEHVDVARLAHGAWVLSRANKLIGGNELNNAAGKVIDTLISKVVHEPDQGSCVAELSFLLLALCNLPEDDPRCSQINDLANTLWQSIKLPHGRIITHKDPNASDAFQDYFPGQVLLALATASKTIDEQPLHRSFQYYRHRFRYKRNFGQVTWLLQAFSKWWQVTGETHFAELVFEIADWLLGYQQDKTGAFINDHQSNTPGYTTAVYLEGVAAALPVAKGTNRYQIYSDSCARGFAFLDQLIIQERDRGVLPNLDFALGGLRQGLHYSEIRTDFVQHSLSAILEFRQWRN